jgi:hypothetical protein
LLSVTLIEDKWQNLTDGQAIEITRNGRNIEMVRLIYLGLLVAARQRQKKWLGAQALLLSVLVNLLDRLWRVTSCHAGI